MATELSEKKVTNVFASNWLERLRQIKRIKSKAVASGQGFAEHLTGYDFTKYT